MGKSLNVKWISVYNITFLTDFCASVPRASQVLRNIGEVALAANALIAAWWSFFFRWVGLCWFHFFFVRSTVVKNWVRPTFIHQYPQADSWRNPGIPPEHCHLHSNPSCIWIDLRFGGDCQGRSYFLTFCRHARNPFATSLHTSKGFCPWHREIVQLESTTDPAVSLLAGSQL